MEELKLRVNQLAQKIVDVCIKHELTVSFAESMTGGLLSSELTAIENASKVMKESVVVYSNEAKVKILECLEETIEEYSVYSIEVIQEMLHGLVALSDADILVAVSGVAGPNPHQGFDVGTVFIGIDVIGHVMTYQKEFVGNRQEIRFQTVEFIFQEILNLIL